MTPDDATAPFRLDGWLAERRTIVERALEAVLERLQGSCPGRLVEAMNHALLGGGKRLRPALVLGSAAAVGGRAEGPVLDFACAVELVHAYSLAHDDLPAMDDDDLRRGRPTCHKAFGEAMAILAGDALLTEAFRLLGRGGGQLHARLIALLGGAAGAEGMVGGQADDVRGSWPRSLDFLESLHRRKTGALIAAACEGGALAAGADAPGQAALGEYGRRLGLAFQIADDLLDAAEGAAGSDARKGKPTFPALLGEAGARERARAEAEAARLAIRSLLPAAAPLWALAGWAVERDH